MINKEKQPLKKLAYLCLSLSAIALGSPPQARGADPLEDEAPVRSLPKSKDQEMREKYRFPRTLAQGPGKLSKLKGDAEKFSQVSQALREREEEKRKKEDDFVINKAAPAVRAVIVDKVKIVPLQDLLLEGFNYMVDKFLKS